MDDGSVYSSVSEPKRGSPRITNTNIQDRQNFCGSVKLVNRKPGRSRPDHKDQNVRETGQQSMNLSRIDQQTRRSNIYWQEIIKYLL